MPSLASLFVSNFGTFPIVPYLFNVLPVLREIKKEKNIRSKPINLPAAENLKTKPLFFNKESVMRESEIPKTKKIVHIIQRNLVLVFICCCRLIPVKNP